MPVGTIASRLFSPFRSEDNFPERRANAAPPRTEDDCGCDGEDPMNHKVDVPARLRDIIDPYFILHSRPEPGQPPLPSRSAAVRSQVRDTLTVLPVVGNWLNNDNAASSVDKGERVRRRDALAARLSALQQPSFGLRDRLREVRSNLNSGSSNTPLPSVQDQKTQSVNQSEVSKPKGPIVPAESNSAPPAPAPAQLSGSTVVNQPIPGPSPGIIGFTGIPAAHSRPIPPTPVPFNMVAQPPPTQPSFASFPAPPSPRAVRITNLSYA